jgi:hypothetical protein
MNNNKKKTKVILPDQVVMTAEQEKYARQTLELAEATGLGFAAEDLAEQLLPHRVKKVSWDLVHDTLGNLALDFSIEAAAAKENSDRLYEDLDKWTPPAQKVIYGLRKDQGLNKAERALEDRLKAERKTLGLTATA